MKKKYIIMASLSVILTLLLGIGVSYSLWNISVSQDKVNTAMTSCFDITYSSESSAINLEKQYPISDEAGSKLTPYTFKITNNCDINAYYKINLETLNTSNIDTGFIKASLNNTNPQVINKYNGTEVSLKNGKVANTLKSGYLPVGGSISFDLRVWLDYDTTINDIKNDGTDKWVGKIAVISNPVTEDEINKVCQSNGGDLIDDGECRKYYVKLNNMVAMENIEFGNESDGCKVNREYNSEEKSWKITYCGSNKWFGWLLNFEKAYNHTLYSKYKFNYSSDFIPIEIAGRKNNESNISYDYRNIKIKNLSENDYSFYFNLSKIYNKIENITYETFFIYRILPSISKDEISMVYYLKKFEIIDLTLMFGEGNEPSREWCDKYLTNYYEYNEEGTLTPTKEIGEPIKTSYYDKIDMYD